MLVSSASREAYDQNRKRWESLQAWLNNPANVKAAEKIHKPIEVFYENWKKIDEGLLSDADQMHTACLDLNTAEQYAVEQGYAKPLTVTACSQPEQLRVQPVIQAGQAAEGFCQDPKNQQDPLWSKVCTATSPKDLSWCQRAGFPGATCTEKGLEPWFVYALGAAGVGVLGLAVYSAYKAAQVVAPYALAYYAPGALSLYQAARAGDRAAMEQAGIDIAKEKGIARRSRLAEEANDGVKTAVLPPRSRK